MDTIDECKNKGNDNFKRASAMGGSDPRAASLLKEACLQYAKSIEALGSWEINILEEGKDLNSDESFGKIEMLKPRLFLNLGMANAKLKDFVSCRRCCNVALLFCNESSTPLCDLPDILDDMAVLLPVVKFGLAERIHRITCNSIFICHTGPDFCYHGLENSFPQKQMSCAVKQQGRCAWRFEASSQSQS